MTLLLDRPADTGSGVLVGVAELHHLLDRLHAHGPWDVISSEHAVVVTELDRATRRLEALKLRMLAATDKTTVATDAGYTDTGAWVARQTTVSRATAARQVALATELHSDPDRTHDATAAALDSGLVSPEHAAVIVHATSQLPDTITQTQRRQVEAALVDKATRFNPDQLRRLARRALETVEPDQVAVDAAENEQLHTEEQAARSRCSFTFHDNNDGTTTGHFTIPHLAAGILKKVLESMTAPRRMRTVSPGPLNVERAGAAEQGAVAGPRDFDWRHRRGLAFAELYEHLPTDHLHPKTAATLVVTLDHTVLHDALKAARLDTGNHLTAGEARRLACGAAIIPAVLGGPSVALDLGRTTRLFTEPQRLALGLRHHTCAADGCERPYAWCELHHRQPWAHGGTTNLDDAIPLCHHHHQRIHDHHYHHVRQPDGTIRFSRRK